MSANRSVQAAQRRRTGSANGEPAIPGRGPQPSINSAQMFANQARPGFGPNMPTGRLAGQQAAMQQQQMQQQQMQQQQMQQQNKLSSVTKMTIPQAITLITLRLGVIESKLLNQVYSNNMGFEGEAGMDSGFLQSIMSRLEELENRPASAGSGALGPELNLIKQEFKPIKQAVIQTKNSIIALVKDNTALKTQVENIKKELYETKELVVALQNLTTDNSQKILALSMEGIMEYTNNSNIIPFQCLQDELTHDTFTDLQDDSEQNEIVGTDLKQLIESELNTGM